MIHDLGPRSRRIFETLQQRILSGELKGGTQLPPHTRLAQEYGVASMTIRHVLARLEDAGLVSRELGRGTFVRSPAQRAPLAGTSDTLFLKLREAALIVDRVSGTVIAWNPGAVALLGYSANVAVGRAVASFVPERVQAELRVQAVPGTDPLLDAEVPLELPLRRGGGDEVWVEAAASPLDDERVLLVLRDRTARRAAQEQRAFQAQLLEAVEHALIATDPAGRIVYWNRAAERLYGWPAAEVLGRNVGDVMVAPAMWAHGHEIMERLRQGETWRGEFAVQRRDGTMVPVLVADSPIRHADGRLVGIIGVSVDMSAREEAERERVARARLEAHLHAAEAVHHELSRVLSSNVPRAGELAHDPRLPQQLRPLADEVLDSVRAVAARLGMPLDADGED